MEESDDIYLEYSDINPDFKEKYQMSKNDTGIDLCNLINTLVQCKLRNNNLTWKECATFFASQNAIDDDGEPYVKWKKLIIARNADSKLSSNMRDNIRRFLDKTYDISVLKEYCKSIMMSYIPIEDDVVTQSKLILRDYQEDCVNLIKTNISRNIIISLPTGTGKNIIILSSLEPDKKYLILVPRCILLEQLKSEIEKHRPELKNTIQLIGDDNSTYNPAKNITICVFNSISHVIENINNFARTYIDEAHHIFKPEIYSNDDDSINVDSINDDDNINDDDSITNESIKDETYIDTIRKLEDLNNVVALSATIDERDEFAYYTKNIREMIDAEYLSDYEIHIPIFSDDPTHVNICEYLLKHYRSIIIYCSSQKEGKQINKLLNKLQKGSSNYIDSKTNKRTRQKIIKDFKSGELPFLVNVEVLTEGFDAPITNGVCFIHAPVSTTKIIQVVGRSLRLHPSKKTAKIILPYLSGNDEKGVCKFLKIIAKNDDKIMNSYKNKILGGRISLEKIKEDIEEDEDDNDNENDNEQDKLIELRFTVVFNSFGTLQNVAEVWKDTLDEVKKFIVENKKRPNSREKNKQEDRLAHWLSNNNKNYKKKEGNVWNDPECKAIWEEFINDARFKVYFITDQEIWKEYLQKVKEFIIKNNKSPNPAAKNTEENKMGQWLHQQKQKYKKQKYTVWKDPECRALWEDFINDPRFKEYLMTGQEKWKYKLQKVKDFIIKNKKTPNSRAKNTEENILGKWLIQQKQNYINKSKGIWKHLECRALWEEFMNDELFKEYFMPNEESWKDNLQKVKNFIIENKKTPNSTDKDEEERRLNSWLSNQNMNYKKQKYTLWNYPECKKLWEEFINDELFKDYFMTEQEKWKDNLQKVKEFIIENKKRPNSKAKDKEENIMGKWLSNQNNMNYKNKEGTVWNYPECKKLWEEFINDELFKEYFITYQEIWKEYLQKVKEFIIKNNRRPTSVAKCAKEKILGCWLNQQNIKYKKKEGTVCKEPECKKLWEEFKNNHCFKELIMTYEEIWKDKLQQVKQFIIENNKRPSEGAKDEEENIIGKWLNHQNMNYKNKEGTFCKEPECKALWEDFINDENFKEYLMTKQEIWKDKLQQVKHFIIKNNKRCSNGAKDEEEKRLGTWLSHQEENYKKNRGSVWKDPECKKLWEEFINDEQYAKYL